MKDRRMPLERPVDGGYLAEISRTARSEYIEDMVAWWEGYHSAPEATNPYIFPDVNDAERVTAHCWQLGRIHRQQGDAKKHPLEKYMPGDRVVMVTVAMVPVMLIGFDHMGWLA